MNKENCGDYSLKNEFKKAVPPFLIYLASTIIIISFLKDVARVGFNPYWLAIRLFYLPFMLVTWKMAKNMVSNKFYELPLWASGLYITLFCTYFSLSTGGLKSDYLFGLIQFYFGIAVMPITAFSFYSLTAISLGIFASLNLLYFEPNAWPHSTNTSNIFPLFIFALIVYFITSRIRKEKLNLQKTLAETLLDREKTIQLQAKKLTENETKAAISLLAVQMAHDIRSPLAALNTISTEILKIAEEPRTIMRSAITRINDIANNLLNKYKQGNDGATENLVSPELVSVLIDRMISEKRFQFASNSISFSYLIDASAQGTFANMSLVEFKRVISNLLNNSIEAVTNNGKIEIKLSANENRILITIEDNGCGIHEDKLQSLFQEGATTKTGGIGLGLYHAKKVLKSWGGSIKIESTLGSGTLVTLELPKTSAPQWFCEKLVIPSKTKIIIFDDDETIHGIWNARFATIINHSIELIHIYDVEHLIRWHHENSHFSSIYLCDHELIGQNPSGLDLIMQLEIGPTSFLVTNRYEDNLVREGCTKINLKIIPKDFSAFIPIEVKNSNPDLILIDNDMLLTSTWQMQATSVNKNIAIFNDAESALNNIALYAKDTAIYIDSDLGNKVKGEEIAKTLFLQGFNTIYLTTGFDVKHFAPMSWIKAIVGKLPPF